MRIAIIGRRGGSTGSSHDDIPVKIKEFISALHVHGHQVIIEQDTAVYIGVQNLAEIKKTLDYFDWASIMSFEDISKTADAAVIFGGDGTMLDAARRLAPLDHRLPLIGVNQGRLGFITDVAKEGATNVLLKTLHPHVLKRINEAGTSIHTWNAEERVLLETFREGCGDTRREPALALNDVVLNKVDGRIIEFQVYVDDTFAYQVRADGIIISTPTGSTAYALSAGGPIISPRSSVLEIIPMFPQTLSYRPLIVPDDAVIEVKLIGDSRGMVYADGNEVNGIFDSKAGLVVFKSKRRATFLHPENYDYTNVLRQKLNWHLQPGSKPEIELPEMREVIREASGDVPDTKFL